MNRSFFDHRESLEGSRQSYLTTDAELKASGDYLMWGVLTHLRGDKLPVQRRVVRFEFRDEKKRYWLVLRRDDPDLLQRPAFGTTS